MASWYIILFLTERLLLFFSVMKICFWWLLYDLGKDTILFSVWQILSLGTEFPVERCCFLYCKMVLLFLLHHFWQEGSGHSYTHCSLLYNVPWCVFFVPQARVYWTYWICEFTAFFIYGKLWLYFFKFFFWAPHSLFPQGPHKSDDWKWLMFLSLSFLLFLHFVYCYAFTFTDLLSLEYNLLLIPVSLSSLIL